MGSASFTASVDAQNLADLDSFVESEDNDYETRSDVLDDAIEAFIGDGED